MSDNKTVPTRKSVVKFLNSIPDAERRQDCFEILKIMKQVTKTDPVIWGDSIVGFGKYSYKYASGREGDWFVVGFSPRKRSVTSHFGDACR